MSENYFDELNRINVNDKTEKKGGLTYLSWAWAWSELKKHYPDSFFTIYENRDGLNYHHDGRTAWVKTGVTVVFDRIVNGERERHGIENVEYLPIMNNRNRSIPLEQITSFDVNTAIQRSLTKAVARHGLGLYIYAGEDLPEDDKPQDEAPQELYCADCGRPIRDGRKKNGAVWKAADIAAYTHAFAGRDLCDECGAVEKAKQEKA